MSLESSYGAPRCSTLDELIDYVDSFTEIRSDAGKGKVYSKEEVIQKIKKAYKFATLSRTPMSPEMVKLHAAQIPRIYGFREAFAKLLLNQSQNKPVVAKNAPSRDEVGNDVTETYVIPVLDDPD